MHVTQVHLFYYKGKPIRIFFAHNEPYFVAKDVCAAAGIAHHRGAASVLAAKNKTKVQLETSSGFQQFLAVNEYGVFTLIVRSRKSAAEPFRDWLTKVLVPQLRKINSSALVSMTEEMPQVKVNVIQSTLTPNKAKRSALSNITYKCKVLIEAIKNLFFAKNETL